MDYATLTIAVAATLLTVVWLVLAAIKQYNGDYNERIPKNASLPPGPSGLPFLGDVRTLFNGPSAQRMLAWSRIYGSVVRVKAGSSEIVSLNDMDSIRTFLNHKDFLYRSKNWVVREIVELGFSGYGGAPWDKNRRFSFKILRDLGFGRSAMGDIISEGCRVLISKIAESQGQPIDLFDLILASVSSNFEVLLLGYRYPLQHREHQLLCKALRDEFRTTRDGSVLSFYPSLAKAVAKCLPFSETATLFSAMKWIETFSRTHLSHRMTTLPDKEDRDFIDAYIRKTKEYDKKTEPAYGLSCLVGNIVSFLVAGAVSASASLMREFLLVAANPDTIQARIQSEIDAVVGSERQPSWEDRASTPYTMGFIWEAHRRYTIAPLGLPRRAYQDVVIGDHFIPKDATVVPNIWAVHNNPAIWKDPANFDPSRFLKSDGTLSKKKLKKIIPFSVGRRMCPGEIFASVEIYIYLTSILQKFHVLPVEGDTVDVDVKYGEIMEPGRQKLRCVPRINTSS